MHLPFPHIFPETKTKHSILCRHVVLLCFVQCSAGLQLARATTNMNVK